MKKFFILFFVFSIAASSQGLAQKFGHLNTGNLLTMLPEIAMADSLLGFYRDSLIEMGNMRADSLRAKTMKFIQKRNSGELNRIQEQDQGAALQKEQEELGAYEQEVMDAVQNRRQQLLGPILERVNLAIQEIGKENKYTMIFDTSIMNAILYTKEADDILPLVLAKLGLEP